MEHCGKRSAGYLHCLLFSQFFLKGLFHGLLPSPIVQSIEYRTLEQVAGWIPSSANILSEDRWWTLQQDSLISLLSIVLTGHQWEAASGSEKILCGVLIKRNLEFMGK